MSYTDLRDFESEFEYTDDYGQRYQLEKLGGGTVGKAYEGAWRYVVSDAGGEIHRGQDFRTGTPKTHEQAARLLAEYFEPEE